MFTARYELGPYITEFESFTARYELSPYITEVESVYSAVRNRSLYNSG